MTLSPRCQGPSRMTLSGPPEHRLLPPLRRPASPERRRMGGDRADALSQLMCGASGAGAAFAALRASRNRASDDRLGLRSGASIRSTLTVSLRRDDALAEADLDARRGAVLVRRGKGDRRREVAWTSGPGNSLPRGSRRASSCRGPLFCVVTRATRGRPWSAAAARSELRRVAREAGVRRRFAPRQLRHAHAVEMAHEGAPLMVIQRQLGHYVGDPSLPIQRDRFRDRRSPHIMRDACG
jgi:hypothetical protein